MTTRASVKVSWAHLSFQRVWRPALGVVRRDTWLHDMSKAELLILRSEWAQSALNLRQSQRRHAFAIAGRRNKAGAIRAVGVVLGSLAASSEGDPHKTRRHLVSKAELQSSRIECYTTLQIRGVFIICLGRTCHRCGVCKLRVGAVGNGTTSCAAAVCRCQCRPHERNVAYGWRRRGGHCSGGGSNGS